MNTSLKLPESMFLDDLYRIPPKTTVVISTPWSGLSERDVTLLSGILQSVKHSLASVRIVEKSSITLSDWIEKPKRLIGFDVAMMQVERYESVHLSTTKLVLADSLSELAENSALKKKLWMSLKQVFYEQE